jgi:NADPH-dependent 7-cyano-7-deazaguanine reductase QueF-like protein
MTIWDEFVHNVLLWKFNVPATHHLDRVDYYYELFYNDKESRKVTYIYHGCKDSKLVLKLLTDMIEFYQHPLTIYDSYPFNKVRLGRNNDGGYIIADLPDNSYDIIISGGIANDISFEIDIQNKYKLKCIAFDGSIDKLPQPMIDIEHIKLNITDINSSTTTNLRTYFNTFNNIFMKLDIEGSEELLFKTLSEVDLSRVKQLVIEIHKNTSYIPAQLIKTHYLIHVHGNNYGGVGLVNGVPIPNVFELTYLRKDCFRDIPKFNTQLIPIEGLDQPNGPNRPETILHCKPYTYKYIQHPWVQTSYGSFSLAQDSILPNWVSNVYTT